ncbi:Dyp-type peroxidase [Streptomyces sp. NPDC002144]
MSSRRTILTTSLATALGIGGLGAVGAAVLKDEPTPKTSTPAPLRGAAPLPYAQVISLDLDVSEKHRIDALRTVHRRVAAIDGAKTAAWMALGAAGLPGGVDAPSQLKGMPSFTGDVLQPSHSHGDLLLQVTGTSTRAVKEAADQTLHALPQWNVRWCLAGHRPENRTEHGRGLARNPFHFTEGYGNPATAPEITRRAIITADQNEPAWTVGGSYQVIRIIQLATGFWDKETIHEQERIIGRRQDGRWLDGTPNDERAAFTSDPDGKITPLDAHVRRAAPDRRHPPPLVRRGYNYHHRTDDQGLIFSCFQHDLAQGFEAVQRGLQGEAMAKYTLTIGGGYFFVPPPGDTWLHALA